MVDDNRQFPMHEWGEFSVGYHWFLFVEYIFFLMSFAVGDERFKQSSLDA
jgi:hypothetical protein